MKAGLKALLWYWPGGEGAHYRRAVTAVNDASMATVQAIAAAERELSASAKALEALPPTPSLEKDHRAALALLVPLERPSDLPARERTDRSIGRRAAMRRLAERARTEGATDFAERAELLRQAVLATEARSGRLVLESLEKQERRLRRARPPASMADEHEELLGLAERYTAATGRLYAAIDAEDRDAAGSAGSELAQLGEDIGSHLTRWQERVFAASSGG